MRILPKGGVFWFHELEAQKDAPEQQLRIGKAEYCDIVVRDNPGVADTHCFLLWSRDRLEVRDFAPGKVTKFNDIDVVDGHILLDRSHVLSIGSEEKVTHIVACGPKGNDRPLIPVRDFPELVTKSPAYHGNKKQTTARALGLDRTTFSRLLTKHSGSLAVLACVLGGGLWLNSQFTDSQSASQVDRVPTVEESAPSEAPATTEPTQLPASSVVDRLVTETTTEAPPVPKPKPKRTKKRKRKRKPANDPGLAKPEEPRLAEPMGSKRVGVQREPKPEPEDAAPHGLGVYHREPVGALGVSAAEQREERKREANR